MRVKTDLQAPRPPGQRVKPRNALEALFLLVPDAGKLEMLRTLASEAFRR